MNPKLCTVLLSAILVALVSGLPAEERAPKTSRTDITVKKMHCAGCAQKIAARLYAVRGVKEVRVDVKKKTLFVMPVKKVVLSPRALWEAVEKAKDVPIRLSGPSGTFTKKPKA